MTTNTFLFGFEMVKTVSGEKKLILIFDDLEDWDILGQNFELTAIVTIRNSVPPTIPKGTLLCVCVPHSWNFYGFSWTKPLGKFSVHSTITKALS